MFSSLKNLLSIRNFLKFQNHLVSKFFKSAEPEYVRVPQIDDVAQISGKAKEMMLEDGHLFKVWGQQFVDALMVLH